MEKLKKISLAILIAIGIFIGFAILCAGGIVVLQFIQNILGISNIGMIVILCILWIACVAIPIAYGLIENHKNTKSPNGDALN